MPEVEIEVTRVTRAGVEHLPGVSDSGDGLFIAGNDGLVTVIVSGTGSFHAVPAPAATGWPEWAADERTLSGETREYGPWPPAVYNREDGSVLFVADPGLDFVARGI